MAVTTQITQISDPGLSLSTAMVNAGLTTFNKILQTNARELELVRIASTENDCNYKVIKHHCCLYLQMVY